MNTTRRRCDSTLPQDAGRDDFTSDDADLLVAECFALNRGIVQDAWFRLCMYNLPEIYRVVVTTEREETDLEFYKLTGTTRLWRDGLEVTVN